MLHQHSRYANLLPAYGQQPFVRVVASIQRYRTQLSTRKRFSHCGLIIEKCRLLSAGILFEFAAQQLAYA
jgi:hypothetical protein